MAFRRNRLGWVLAVGSVLVACGSAQKCYYPDGSSAAQHTSCAGNGTYSACCAPSAFCLDNGLCFQEGVVTRGSCTDQTWDSEACAGYCKQENPSGSVAITPCSNDGSKSTFACGLNNTRCRNAQQTFGLVGSSVVVLRPAQISELVAPVLSSVTAQAAASATASSTASALAASTQTTATTATSCPQAQALSTDAYYTSGQMAGLGVGLAIPLVIAACTAFMLWNKERARHPRLMYQLPDDDIMEFKPSPASMFPAHPAVRSIPPSRESNNSDFTAFWNGSPSPGRETPPHMQTFAERYQAMSKQMARSPLQEQHSFELDGQPVGSAFRFTTHGKPIERQKSITVPTTEPSQRMSTTTTKSARDRDRR